jgi:hypothetical protein
VQGRPRPVAGSRRRDADPERRGAGGTDKEERKEKRKGEEKREKGKEKKRREEKKGEEKKRKNAGKGNFDFLQSQSNW